MPFVVTQSCRDRRLPWLWREPAPQRCQRYPACHRAARTPGGEGDATASERCQFTALDRIVCVHLPVTGPADQR